MFVLPLPLSKTVETLGVGESGLPKPELYVMMDGTPTKNKVVGGVSLISVRYKRL